MTSSRITVQQPTGTPPELHELGFDERTWDKPWNIVRGHQTMAERMPTAILPPGDTIDFVEGPELNIDHIEMRDPLLNGTLSLPTLLDQRLVNDGLLVVHQGKKILERYRNGMTPSTHHVVHSCSKTLTAMLAGWAFEQGLLTPQTAVVELIPELEPIAAWHGVTIQHVLDMAAGISTDEHYEDPHSMYWRYAETVSYYGVSGNERGVLSFVEEELNERAAAPGTVFNYASYLSNLIPIMIERAADKNALDLLHEHIYSHIGAEHAALINVDCHGRPIVEGQVNITLRDFARWAYLLLNDGKNLAGKQVIPKSWVDEAFTSSSERRAAFLRSDYAGMFPTAEYHNQAWLIDPQQGHLTMLGIHGQFAYIDRPKQLLIVGMSSFSDQANPLFASYLKVTWEALTHSV